MTYPLCGYIFSLFCGFGPDTTTTHNIEGVEDSEFKEVKEFREIREFKDAFA
jgi:hypothetical protein